MRALVNGALDLHYEIEGAGEAIVFVHGGFTDHQAWRFVAPALAESFQVVTYDRRGHSSSGPEPGPASRADEERDLIGLIEALDLGRVHLVGSSYGGSIVLGTAACRPDLVRSVVAHEPALLHLVQEPDMVAIERKMQDVAEQLAAGDLVGGTRRFVEELILGQGWWDRMPDVTRDVMVANSPTIVDMITDPGWASLDVDELEGTGIPVLVTDGDASPPWLRLIVTALAALAPSATRRTYAGAGHMPHITHPTDLEEAVRGWVTRSPVPPRRPGG
jgi:pimeloyl-ACP methyl ester carboxylesterase